MANWQESFKLKANLVQRDIYAFENELRLQEKASVSLDTVIDRTFQILQRMALNVNANIETEHNLKAAVKAGWVESPPCEIEEVTTVARKTTRYLLDGVNVDEMHPGRVRWYGLQIIRAYNDAVAIPDPNS